MLVAECTLDWGEGTQVSDNILLSKALIFAAGAHEGQFREGTSDPPEPYIEHPKRVVALLQDWGVRPWTSNVAARHVLAIAALHDVLEDTTTMYSTLYREFGSFIAGGVDLLSKPRQDEYFRNKRYRAILGHAPWYIRLVKAADRVDNLNSLQGARWDLERIRDYVEDSNELFGLLGTSEPEVFTGELMGSGQAALQEAISRVNRDNPW